eukprot:TRINITY_DN29933_c0_g1_i1.p1 TRINITY_DN29933_c0_g1~~TRINITY_DN29933_c0_g1_i1.p1  ORF type:complete len:277 (-),score=34.84 TRINITY_DN29933_c0_g1_i1:119-949(-)
MHSLSFVARALACAGATSLGCLPIALIGDMTDAQMGAAIATAAGMMSGCSLVLATEVLLVSSCLMLLLGFGLGAVLIHAIQWVFADREDLTFGDLKGTNASGAIVIFLCMTLHSLGEGLSIGVTATQPESHEQSSGLNSVVLLSLAIHNIPEGMAICMAYRSKGMSLRRSALYAFLSNLPQPLSALASFGCMTHLSANSLALPIGLGMASGAMCYVVAKELAPEALTKTSSRQVKLVMLVSALVVLMLDAYSHFGGSHDSLAELSSANGMPIGQEL